MIFNQNCNNLNIKYYEELIEINIEFIKIMLKDFKIVTKESQVDKQIKKPNFSCRNIINENLTILEMEKTSVVYNYPILIGSIILQNSKVHMFNYLYKIYPRLFGNYTVLYQDTDSIYAKLNISHDEYLKILEENKDLFGDKIIGQMEVENLDNPIKEFIALSSKCYSYICEKEIKNNKNKLKYNIVHTKGISDSYKIKNIDHSLFKKTLIGNVKPNKISFNNISVKNQQIKTNTIIKNNIEFLNDKRYISNINDEYSTYIIYRMIYEHDCYNLNVKYFDNLIEINIKNIPNKFIRFKIYENILEIFRLNKVDIIIKYYDQEFLIYTELDLKNVFKKLEIK